jgi:hypothetical protein
MIPDSENVARAIFSPKMIIEGEIQPEAFRLRASIGEEYLSVMRMSFPSWPEDIKMIPQRKNRKLYGFAEMNVGDIRHIPLKNVEYDVRECPQTAIASHAGIFISINGEDLIGGKSLGTTEPGTEQDFLILAIQRELVEIAQKGLFTL